jgi:hypothetical protein
LARGFAARSPRERLPCLFFVVAGANKAGPGLVIC